MTLFSHPPLPRIGNINSTTLWSNLKSGEIQAILPFEGYVFIAVCSITSLGFVSYRGSKPKINGFFKRGFPQISHDCYLRFGYLSHQLMYLVFVYNFADQLFFARSLCREISSKNPITTFLTQKSMKSYGLQINHINSTTLWSKLEPLTTRLYQKFRAMFLLHFGRLLRQGS